MVVVLTIREMSYLVLGLLDDLVGSLCICICDIKFFGCVVCFNSAKALNPFTTNKTIRPKDIFEATIGINSIRNKWLCIPVV